MTFQRLFSEEQLIELAKPPARLAEEALARGDLERVRGLIGEMANGHKPLHVLGLHTLARMWGKYRNDFGEEPADRMLAAIAERLTEQWAADWSAHREKDTIAAITSVYRNQAGARIMPSETDDAVVLELTPCGSGGMLHRQKWDERHPEWYAPFSNGTPLACRACKALQAALNAQCGDRIWTTENAPDRSGTCRMTFAKQATRGERLFDGPEELSATRPAQALARLDRGDVDIGGLIHEQHREWQPWHDFMLCWLEYTFAAFHEAGGYDLLHRAFLECYETAFFPRYAVFEQWSDTERVQRSAWSWYYHMGRIRILEEEHRFVFVLEPCGSGARLFSGAVDAPPFRYGKPLAPLTKEPHELSFGRTDFPLYCSHCAATNGTQFDGLPLIFVVDGHAQLHPGMPCRQYLYKKGAPRQVEQRLLSQINRETVAPAQPLEALS